MKKKYKLEFDRDDDGYTIWFQYPDDGFMASGIDMVIYRGYNSKGSNAIAEYKVRFNFGKRSSGAYTRHSAEEIRKLARSFGVKAVVIRGGDRWVAFPVKGSYRFATGRWTGDIDLIATKQEGYPTARKALTAAKDFVRTYVENTQHLIGKK
jgi:hypothetical protein